LQQIDWPADIFEPRQQEVVLDVEHAGDAFGALEHDAELHEIIREVARNRALANSGDSVKAILQLGEKCEHAGRGE